MVGITSYGAYIPYYRLPRSVIGKAWGTAGGRGEKAVANYDEDVNTMAVAAGIDCLKGVDRKAIDALFLATTDAPYKERQNSTIVSTALDLGREARTADFTDCLRVGTIALFSALDAVKAETAGKAMIVASDTRPARAAGEDELAFGDGAAALLLGDKGVVAEIEGHYTWSEDFPDYWRAAGDNFVRSGEDRWCADMGYLNFPAKAVAGIMKKYKLTPKDFAKVCLYGPNSRRHQELVKKIGFDPAQVQDPLLDTVGNTGAALPFMILVAALEQAKPGDRILLVSYGNGSDALVLRVTEEIEKVRDRRGIAGHLARKAVLGDYNRYVRWRGLIDLQPPARPPGRGRDISIHSLYRESKTFLACYGVKCKRCGYPNLYMDHNSAHARVCAQCNTRDEFEDYCFADKKARVVTFTDDYLQRSGDPPATLAVLDFEGGGRGAFDLVDRDPKETKVGLPVELTFRKIFFENGIHSYGWKCRPVRDAA